MAFRMLSVFVSKKFTGNYNVVMKRIQALNKLASTEKHETAYHCAAERIKNNSIKSMQQSIRNRELLLLFRM